MTTPPSSRPRNGRRESTSAATGANRVRKNSVASNPNSVRPRANTTGHVESSAVGVVHTAPSPSSAATQSNDTRHSSIGSASALSNFDYRGFGTTHSHVNTGLTKLETAGLPIDLSGGLRTAPAYGGFDFGFGDMLMGHGSTINPAQLHFADSPHPFGNDIPPSPFSQAIQDLDPMMDEEYNFDWMDGFDPFLMLGNSNESAIDESSPSAMSTGSQSGISEAVIDGSNPLPVSSSGWPSSFPGHIAMPPTTQLAMDFTSPTFNDTGIPPETVSPKSLMAQNQFADVAYGTPPSMAPVGQPLLGGHSQSMFSSSSMATNGESPNPLNPPFANNSAPSTHSPADTFTDSTRQALLSSISQSNGFSHRKYSQPTSVNPYSFEFSTPAAFDVACQLPSTSDMKRYISSYVTYFHPHLSFLHVPTLNFQASEYTQNLQVPSGHLNLSSSGVAGGAGCLTLSIAAIGALYESDTAASKDLMEASKKMIQRYLEERRKVDMSTVLGRANSARESSAHAIPLWLIQAMLLNVIYGHASGDKMSADIACTHCAALVSLARAADLTRHVAPKDLPPDYLTSTNGNDAHSHPNSSAFGIPKERRDWLNWKMVEERKRSLFAIFVVSSLLVASYNCAPALTNSEIRLDLPCEESVWAAESPQAWKKMGGPSSSKDTFSFSSALTTLLTASQREQKQSQPTPSPLRPSSFGCLVLILALHNYIWETRQRHMGRQWTSREADAMQAHIEPALRAWQAAWASNPIHSLERPNPFGAGPLSADSIPLLDLAYVRLFVNIGRSREAFCQRDWNAMADELTRGTEIIHADTVTPDPSDRSGGDVGSQVRNRHDSVADLGVADLSLSKVSHQTQTAHDLPNAYRTSQSAREKHLRKAAFYAADSMAMSDRLGNTFGELTSRELPLQSALCTFDCGQVLAEWICTVQERVGPYLGILGQDEIDLTQVPGIMLLEDEDCKLVEKIKDILGTIETKIQRAAQNSGSVPAFDIWRRLPSVVEGGFGSKIAIATACVLDRASVWPG